MHRRFLFVVLLGMMFVGCQSRDAAEHYDIGMMALPQGHATTGRRVFLDKKCASCHRVEWDRDLPEPTGFVAAPVLDARLSRSSTGYLATSIVTPSYEVREPYGEAVPARLSPMADYSDAITLRELVDLIAYVKQGAEAPVRPVAPVDWTTMPHHL